MPWLDLAMLCGLTLLGLGLRLFDIDRESLWLDEAGRVAIALRPTWDIAHAVGVIELSPPLYHYALHAWIALAGDSDGAVRVLSALLVLPTVPLVASIGAVAGNRGSRLIAAALAATSPFAVHYGQEVAMYALLLPLGLLTLRAALGVLVGPQTERAHWLGVYVVAGTLALYTHYYAALLLSVVLLVGVWHAARRRRMHGVVLWVAAHAIIGLLFLPWLPTLIAQAHIATTAGWVALGPFDALTLWADAMLTDGAVGWGIPALLVLAAAVGLGGFALGDRAVALALLLALVIVPFFAIAASATWLYAFRERGFLAVVGAIWALAACVPLLPRERRLLRVLGLCTGTALAVLTVVGLRGEESAQKEDWRGATALVQQGASADDPIFFVHYAGVVAFDHYFMGSQPLIGLPEDFNWTSGYTAPFVVSPVDVSRRVPPALANAEHAWAVLSHDQGRGSDLLIAALREWGSLGIDAELNGVRVMRFDRVTRHD